VYERPRAPPRIRRPVPLNEREKYEYTPSTGKAADSAVQRATADKAAADAAADEEFYDDDDDDPAAEGASPRSSSAPHSVPATSAPMDRSRPYKKQGTRSLSISFKLLHSTSIRET